MDKSRPTVLTYDKIAKKYTERYFDDLSDFPFVDRFLSYLPQGAKILDLGCGPGTFTKYLLKKGFFAEGIDLSFEMLKIAKEKVLGADFRLMDIRRLDYGDGTFDGLLSAYSLIHVPAEEVPGTLEGFYKVLKPEGVLLTITQVGESDRVVDEPLMAGERIFINFFSKEGLSGLLRLAGFEIVYQEQLPSEDPDSLSDSVIYTIAKKGKNSRRDTI